MVPVDRARESREQLTRLGVALTYREYEMAHEISVEALRERLRRIAEARMLETGDD